MAPGAPARRVAELRARWRARRAALAGLRALERELASYRSQADVDDLLARVGDSAEPDAELVRSILIRNLARRDRAA